MSNTKPSVNYVRYDKKKNKGGKPSQQKTLGKFHGSGSLPSNSKPDANGKLQAKVKFVIDVGKADTNQIRNVVPSMISVANVERKDTLL